MTSLRQRIALISIGVILSLAFFEIAVRCLQHSAVNWSDRPRTYYFAEASPNLREYRFERAKAVNTYRIIVIGDSFTYGEKLQIDSTYPKIAERFLNLNVRQRRVEILNFSVPGFSTMREVLLLRKALATYQPDLILLQVTLNDPELIPRSAQHRDPTLLRRIRECWIAKYWKSFAFVLDRLLNAESHRRYIEYYQDLFTNPETLKNFRNGMNEFVHRTREAGVPLGIILFPLLSHPLDETYPFWNLHQLIQAAAEQAHLPFLDLFSGFQNIPIERLQVAPDDDRHPNEIANRLAAEAVVDWLKDSKLIPDESIPKKFGPTKSPTREVALLADL